MDNRYKKAFIEELEKSANQTTGLVGGLLTGGLLSSAAATAAHHIKGFKEAIIAGASLKQALKAGRVPLGKSWKFEKIVAPGQMLKLDTSRVHLPYESTDLYRSALEDQQDTARLIGMPVGAGVVTFVGAKSHKKKS